MTFKDTNVLLGNDLNDDTDILENAELQSSFKQRLLNKRKQNPSLTGYNPTGEPTKSVLSKYDDFNEEL